MQSARFEKPPHRVNLSQSTEMGGLLEKLGPGAGGLGASAYQVGVLLDWLPPFLWVWLWGVAE